MENKYEKEKRLRTLYNKLYTLKDECYNELALIGVDYDLGQVETWEVNTRAKNRLGVCRHRRASDYYTYHIIGISDWVLEKFSDKDVKNVIMHELLHTIDGCNNHGEKWKRYASKVSRLLDYHITRTEDLEELCKRNNVSYDEFKDDSYKYEITCKKCGKTWHKHRLSARHLLWYRHNNMTHSTCGGKEFMIKDVKLGKVILK